MKLVDKYIVQQYIVTFLFILGMVLVICIIVDFVEKLDLFLDQEIPLEAIILDYYVNFLAYFGNLLSPICIFLGVIFFTSRMASRTEIVPILSSGVHFGRLLLPYLIMGLVALGASFIFKSYLIPISTDARLDFEYKYMGRVKKNLGKRSDIHKKVAADTYVYFHHFNERNNLGTNFGMEKIVDGEVVRKISAQKIKWIDSTQSVRKNAAPARIPATIPSTEIALGVTPVPATASAKAFAHPVCRDFKGRRSILATLENERHTHFLKAYLPLLKPLVA